MKGDFSKWYFDRKKNFNGVLHQQGRVLLDSDWNDQTRIINDWQNQAGRDIIGPGVVAIPASEPDAFEVTGAFLGVDDVIVKVNPGRGWVDGLVICLAGDIDEQINFAATYLQDTDVSSFNDGDRDAVILEVWQEAVNAFQEYDMLIEPALGGPDTTERVHTGMAFRLLRLDEGVSCDNIREKLKDPEKGRLKVTLQPKTETDDVCPEVEKGGYTGFEHNLYRIEIAEVNDAMPRFKWSQFNGGLVGRGTFNQDKVTITANLQAIITSGLSEFYLEALEKDALRDHWKVIYGANVSLNENNELDLNSTPMFGEIPSSDHSVFFRLWNEIREIGEFPIDKARGEPEELRDGIRLEFDAPDGTNYKSGDYWTFPVRAGGIKNDEILIDSQPEGIHYHRAPLAILNWNAEGVEITDCRHVFRPLTDQTVCCTYLVGEHGDFNSIEEALKHLPDSGGEICLLPGLHETNVVIQGKKNIRIRGCGEQTIVRNKPLNNDPIFHVKDSEHIKIENMDMATLHGTAISLEGTLQEIEICHNRIAAINEGIHVDSGIGIKIHNNKIRINDSEGADVAIFIKAEDSVIERNDIGVVPAENILASVFPDKQLDPTGPCPDYDKLHDNTILFIRYAYLIWNYSIDIPQAAQFKALGGIQIAGESEWIKVLENVIKGGAGNGITLGNVTPEFSGSAEPKNIGIVYPTRNPSMITATVRKKPVAENVVPVENIEITSESMYISNENDTNNEPDSLYEIQIDSNEISNMGLSGIGIPLIEEENIENVLARLGTVINLSIFKNHIFDCLQMAPGQGVIGVGGISLGMCEHLSIDRNRIERNGISHINPVCGIYVADGEQVSITHNNISNNGPLSNLQSRNLKPGIRGGIVLTVSSFDNSENTFDFIGRYAARVHDNIVNQPAGQALRIIAYGYVSILNNQFNCELSVFQHNEGAVYICNYGGNFADEKSGKATTNATIILPNGNVLFNSNQICVGPAYTSKWAIYIYSNDDIGFDSNQSDNFQTKFLLINTSLRGKTIRASNNRFKERIGKNNSIISLKSVSDSLNNTTNNQGNHSIAVNNIDGCRAIETGNQTLS